MRLLVLLCLLLPTAAWAGLPADRPLWVEVGGSFGGGLPLPGVSPLGSASGHLTVGLRLLPVVPEFEIREGFAGGPDGVEQHQAGIVAGARILLPRLLLLRGSVRAAFTHQHLASMSLFREKTAGVLFGTASGLSHRTGFETGLALELYVDPKSVVRVIGQSHLLFFPGQDLPIMGLWEIGVAFGVGPRAF